jgi:KDO2-lipid IV(A) lauroyltransferase
MALARTLGNLMHLVLPGRVRMARQEVSRVTGTPIDDPEVPRIVRASFQHFVLVLFELLMLERGLSRRPYDDILRVDGYEKIVPHLKTGAVLASGHLGNWEVVGTLAPLYKMHTVSVGRHIENPYLDRAVNSLRERHGQIVIDKDGAPLRLAREIKRNGAFIGLLLDQHAGSRGLRVEFLDRPASTFPTAGYLARRFKVPIFPFVSYRDGSWLKIRVEVGDPVMADPDLPEDEDVYRMTLLLNRALEKGIREHPDQWLWFHRRWKKGGEEPKPEWLERYARENGA